MHNVLFSFYFTTYVMVPSVVSMGIFRGLQPRNTTTDRVAKQPVNSRGIWAFANPRFEGGIPNCIDNFNTF